MAHTPAIAVATRTELADAFGVEDLDEIADDLYEDYLAFVAAEANDQIRRYAR